MTIHLQKQKAKLKTMKSRINELESSLEISHKQVSSLETEKASIKDENKKLYERLGEV